MATRSVAQSFAFDGVLLVRELEGDEVAGIHGVAEGGVRVAEREVVGEEETEVARPQGLAVGVQGVLPGSKQEEVCQPHEVSRGRAFGSVGLTGGGHRRGGGGARG